MRSGLRQEICTNIISERFLHLIGVCHKSSNVDNLGVFAKHLEVCSVKEGTVYTKLPSMSKVSRDVKSGDIFASRINMK